jgi:phage major head subunit gpT-like protein
MIINQTSLTGMYKSFSTIFSKAYTEAPSQWEQVAMMVKGVGRSTHYGWLGAFPSMKEWVGDRIVKDLSLFQYEIVNKNYESTVEVNRNDLEDDQIAVYTPMVQGLAQAAKQHPDTLIFELLQGGFATACYDGQYFFDTDHPVGSTSVSNTGGGSGTDWYLLDLSRPIKPLILQMRQKPKFTALDRPEDEHVFMRRMYRYGVDDRKNVGFGLWQLAYGSKDTLNATNYAAARAAMMAFKNDAMRPLGIMPTHLVVPPSLESAAREILEVDRLASGAGNPWYKTAKPIVTPFLAA